MHGLNMKFKQPELFLLERRLVNYDTSDLHNCC